MNSIEDPAPGLTVGALEPKPLMRDPLNHPPPLLPHPPPVRFSVDVEEVEEEVLEADAHEAEAVVETGARGDENGTATTATTTTTTTTETMTMTVGAGITHQREALAPASAPAESPPAEDIYALANAIIIANPITDHNERKVFKRLLQHAGDRKCKRAWVIVGWDDDGDRRAAH